MMADKGKTCAESIECRWIEFRFDSLVKDISSDVRLVDYGTAFLDKLTGIRFTYGECKRFAVQLQETIRQERGQQKVILNRTGNLRALTAIYFECFLYFIMGMFDILASITFFIYPEYQEDMEKKSAKKYFTTHMNYFIKKRKINADYSELLCENEGWIDRVARIRDGLTHKASAFLAYSKGRVVFEKRDRYDDFPPEKVLKRYSERKFEDLLEFLNQTIRKMYSFLDLYIIIHRRKIPESDHSKLRHQNFLISFKPNASKQGRKSSVYLQSNQPVRNGMGMPSRIMNRRTIGVE